MKILEIISDLLINRYNKQCSTRNLKLIRRLKYIIDILHKYKNYTDSFEYIPLYTGMGVNFIEFSDNIKVHTGSYYGSPVSIVYYEYSKPQDISKSVQELILDIDMCVVRSRFNDIVKDALKSHIEEGNKEEVIKDLKFCLQNFIF